MFKHFLDKSRLEQLIDIFHFLNKICKKEIPTKEARSLLQSTGNVI